MNVLFIKTNKTAVYSFYKKRFNDQDVLEEKMDEKIAYSHQLHTDYKSGSKFVESMGFFLTRGLQCERSLNFFSV